ncbi:MAG TPA: hypothetical protein PLX23_06975 [Candidatus Hydrogenedens sp.]|nr:hypothetical protein [Candidatus Hydrogenedens sp.]
MKHIKMLSSLSKAEVETELSIGQILTIVANVLSVVAQALVTKETGSTTIS